MIINDNQWQTMKINDNQWQTMIIDDNQLISHEISWWDIWKVVEMVQMIQVIQLIQDNQVRLAHLWADFRVIYQ